MKKIPTLFCRDESLPRHPVYNKVREECEWVLKGEGFATKKIDGMNVKIKDGKFYKRQKPLIGDYDEASYVEVEPASPQNRWLMEAFMTTERPLQDGIYEAVGPKIQGNPEKFESHCLISVVPPSAGLLLIDVPRNYDGLKEYLSQRDMEGIVFHHTDGRMAKVKKKDFGMKR